MKRCFQLAKKGAGNVAPNPLVGAVIVHNDKIIGEGYHRKFGDLHAEPNAVNSVTDKSLLPHSTLYVNLEPCNHFGNTPPCADLVVKSNFKRVVICNSDPNPKVNGSGIEKIQKAGIEVESGVFEKEGLELNKRFFSAQINNRPYIVLKWAQTADGFINHLKPQKALKISSFLNQQLVHKWRSEEAGILIGAKTLLNDKPKLDVRLTTGTKPTPIVLSTRAEDLTTLFWKDRKAILIAPAKPVHLPENIEFISSKEGLDNALHLLLKHGIASILVEGGAKTLKEFIDKNLWDEARVYRGSHTISEGVKAPRLEGNKINFESGSAIDKLTFYKNTYHAND